MASCGAKQQQSTAFPAHQFGTNATDVATMNFSLDQSFFRGSPSHFQYTGQKADPSSRYLASPGAGAAQANNGSPSVTFLVRTPGGHTAQADIGPAASYECFVKALLESAARRDTHAGSSCGMKPLPTSFTQKRCHEEEGRQLHAQGHRGEMIDRRVRRRVEGLEAESSSPCQRPQIGAETASKAAFIMHKGRILDRKSYRALLLSSTSKKGSSEVDVSIRLRLRGGVKESVLR
eukprot:CAMPEP_0185740984 /NCGR_PEP_ID=MMETSP1171-20130828/38715_1 /TAXON_ID=374046 /ORGANISM="Helicotheca tamensis, Strain CCMP826" /LENGTH=233 /DNA_ID=CAMNT_0028412921 /DNA_START=30 /DNA_END=731 /DNA_ORIENTATION=-